MRTNGIPVVSVVCAAALITCASLAPDAAAQCSDELNVVLLASGIYPGTDLQIQKLNVSRVGIPTYPSEDQLLAAVREVYAQEPLLQYNYHHLEAVSGNYNLYWYDPGDFGAATILDLRTGTVLFGGMVVWAGRGHVFVPAADSYTCHIVAGDPAGPPVASAAFPSTFWSDSWGTAEQLTQAALAYARRTDLLHSIAECGDYSVLGFAYTPAVGLTSPDVAVEVLIISGRAGPGWVPVGTERSSWGQVKTLYR